MNDQLSLYESYFTVKGKTLPDKHILFIMRKMRNAVSHGNCLFADMGRQVPTKRDQDGRMMSDIEVTSQAMRMCNRKPSVGGKRKSAFQIALDQLVVNNYAAVLLCHLNYVNSPRALDHACREVSHFIERVRRKQEEYFGSKGKKELRNRLVYSTLNALVTLSQGYIQQARRKAQELNNCDAYADIRAVSVEHV